MTDAREAWCEHYAPGAECPACSPAPVVPEFDVRTLVVHNHDIDPSCLETRLPDGSLRGECMTPRGEDQWWESLVEVACDKGHRIFVDDGDGGVYACPLCGFSPEEVSDD